MMGLRSYLPLMYCGTVSTTLGMFKYALYSVDVRVLAHQIDSRYNMPLGKLACRCVCVTFSTCSPPICLYMCNKSDGDYP